MEAGGVGIFRAIENRQLTDIARRSKRLNLENCAQLERIWNTASRTYVELQFSYSRFLSEDCVVHKLHSAAMYLVGGKFAVYGLPGKRKRGG